MITFGPVPSRRLGRSLGINNIPPKHCSYSCVYCQVGRTSHMQTQRQAFYDPKEVYGEVAEKVRKLQQEGIKIDYLAFVPDGEPALDVNLGKQIELLKPLGVRIAVISNASLIWQKEVQDDLCKADLISLKIDAVSEDIWRRIDRPHKSLQLGRILQGISGFSNLYKGDLITETMLIRDINDTSEEAEKTARFIAEIKSLKSYISTPIRPPSEKEIKSADEHAINTAYQIFRGKNINVECLIGYEGNEFAFTGDAEENLFSIMSVHPMREEAVRQFLKRSGKDWSFVEKSVDENKLKKIEYGNEIFYMRKFSKSGSRKG